MYSTSSLRAVLSGFVVSSAWRQDLMQKETMSSEDAGPSAGSTPEAADSALPRDSAGKHAVSVLWSFGKCVGALLPVYLAGYFGFSISLVLLGLLVYMGWKHSRDGKQARLQSAMHFLENEEDVTTTRVFRSKRELPAWVSDFIPYMASFW